MAAIVSASEGALLAAFKPNSWMHLSAVLLTTGDFCAPHNGYNIIPAYEHLSDPHGNRSKSDRELMWTELHQLGA